MKFQQGITDTVPGAIELLNNNQCQIVVIARSEEFQHTNRDDSYTNVICTESAAKLLAQTPLAGWSRVTNQGSYATFYTTAFPNEVVNYLSERFA